MELFKNEKMRKKMGIKKMYKSPFYFLNTTPFSYTIHIYPSKSLKDTKYNVFFLSFFKITLIYPSIYPNVSKICIFLKFSPLYFLTIIPFILTQSPIIYPFYLSQCPSKIPNTMYFF
ncbi:unnamed protein product [Meloidogyne enterolobii]|uniref:Uncharacterized protein n=1 Tax=Meloidogyne enterolobii TaxID=390850 RepID=A0ACB1A7A9_MELEN